MSKIVDMHNEWVHPPRLHGRYVEFRFRGVDFCACIQAFTSMDEDAFCMLLQDMVDFIEEVEPYEKEDEAP